MRILLINPIVRISVPPAYFPLGLAYIAAVLHQEGHNVEVLDINAYRYSPSKVEEKIKKADYDCVGLTGLITEYHQIKWLAEKLKLHHPDKPIFLGGGLASAMPAYVLENTQIDIVVIGEGEITIKELIGALGAGMDLQKINGIAYKNDNGMTTNRPRGYLTDLDALPLPLFENFPVEIYARGEKGIYFSYPTRTLNIITSRGCPFRCIYCYHGISGYKFRKRSADSIVKEMAYLKERYNLDGIVFSDDTFILDRKRIIKLCEKLKHQKLGLKWSCNGRVDLVDEELLRKMKSAGCVCIGYGIESGSPKILKTMKKGFTIERAEQAISLTREAGLRPVAYFMIGMAGETKDTVNETKEFCKKIGNRTNFSITTPFPGTELFDMAKHRNLLPSFEVMLNKWNIWNYNLLINMSELSDEELLDLKKSAEEEINICTSNKKQELKHFFMEFGPGMTLRRLFYYVLRKIKHGKEDLSVSFKEVERQTREWQKILKG